MLTNDCCTGVPYDSDLIIEVLESRASIQGDKDAVIYLEHGEINDSVRVTYREMNDKAKQTACYLLKKSAKGERAILLFDSSMDFLISFFGCLYAGIIAVPLPVPSRNNLYRFEAVINDCKPALFISETEISRRVRGLLERKSICTEEQWVNTDEIPKDLPVLHTPSFINTSDIAFIQYTSGSTSLPKGVMVSHANMMHNLKYIRASFEITEKSMLSWLPYYHDMGLVGALLEPIYSGVESVIMSPYHFIQKPLRWLQAISYFETKISGGPNFAYDLCTQKVDIKDLDGLNLGSWCSAYVGAEPVRYRTLKNFYEKFKICGFKEEAFYPCYGLAEATLMVSGGDIPEVPHQLSISYKELQKNKVCLCREDASDAVRLVSCGKCGRDQKLYIIDPRTGIPCRKEEVGEIWISGPSVAQGYWRKEDINREIFEGRIPGSMEELYLKTGDLGFVFKDELYITGRIKDLIIIRGANYYPQDIESYAGGCHPCLGEAGTAAFSIEIDGQEQLVVVQEVKRAEISRLEPEAVFSAIRRTISENFNLQVYAVALIKPLSLPKTTSGKVQRQKCRQMFLNRELAVISEWRSENRHEDENKKRSGTEIYDVLSFKEWLKGRVAYHTKVSPSNIDEAQPLAGYGLDSVMASALSGEIEILLGKKVPPTVFYDHPSIKEITGHLFTKENTFFSPEYHDNTGKRKQDEDIAVVGMSCKFPGAAGVQAFWELMEKGRHAVRTIPKERWSTEEFYHAGKPLNGKMITRWGGFIDEIQFFDNDFFDISPREAQKMDPQQRLLLEVTWEALESASLNREKIGGTQTGVFIGISNNDYSRDLYRDIKELDMYTSTGNAFSIAANRISYLFDLHGPSMAIDTACSSSLVAVHLACKSLETGESSLAIAGGVNLIVTPHLNISFSQAQMMSQDGKCKTFDAGADGYVRGEGCGIVILKRLSEALRDNDHIWAVIKGSAVNQDGKSNGLTAPNIEAQKAVIAMALKNARIKPFQVSYIETHGTGTPLGDPIEFNAISQIYSQGRHAKQKCRLGAVKTNIGHLESAAGIAGLIKAILVVKNGKIPANLHFRSINPLIDIEQSLFQIPVELTDWARDDERRIAAVSSFGFGGTNAHVIVEEAPDKPVQQVCAKRPFHILALSAKSDEALNKLAGAYRDYYEHSNTPLSDICYSTNILRSEENKKAAFILDTKSSMKEKLTAYLQGDDDPFVLRSEPQSRPADKIAFVFTGQGSQYYQMGRQLYETHPFFKRELDQCSEILKPYLQVPLLQILYNSGAEELIHQTVYTQPAIFSIEYALAKLWISWGVNPSALLGHSIGEYVAACVAGVFSLEEALMLVAERGRLMGSVTQKGLMAVIFGSEELVQPYLEPYRHSVSAASFNSPNNTVISGLKDDICFILNRMQEKNISYTLLNVSNAFHSPLMAEILELFKRAAHEVKYNEPGIPVLSNVTGKYETSLFCSEDYWSAHIMAPVQFEKSVRALSEDGHKVFIEIGAKPHLSALGMECLHDKNSLWLASMNPKKKDWNQILFSLASLYTCGFPVDWAAFDREYTRNKVLLPAYPFARKKYWALPAAGDNGDYTGGSAADESNILDCLRNEDVPRALKMVSEALDYSEERMQPFSGVFTDLVKILKKQNGKESGYSFYYQLKWEKEDNSMLRLPRECMKSLQDMRPLAEECLLKAGKAVSLKDFSRLVSEMEAVSVHYIFNTFRELGWNPEKGSCFREEDIIKHCSIENKYRRLFSRLLQIAGEEGFFERTSNAWRVKSLPHMESGLSLWKTDILERYPVFYEEADLFHRCASNLAKVITGHQNEIDLLFPSGDDTQINKLYRDTPVSKILNTVIGEIVRISHKEIPENHRLRIIEIGAGTGSTSSYIFPQLPEGQSLYTYTDLSPQFLQTGREKFREYSFIEYKCVDIGRDPQTQGLQASGYDVVIASNVFHATEDLRKCIRHAKSLLSQKGILILLEGTFRQRWMDLIFGLTEGWWNFKDTEIRTDYPLISCAAWSELLREAGFENILDICLPEQGRPLLAQQHIIAAQIPGKSREEACFPVINWLIFGNPGKISRAIMKQICEDGEDYIFVLKGKEFAHNGKEITIDPLDDGHYQKLLELLNTKPQNIVYEWSMQADNGDYEEALSNSAESGRKSLIALIKALHFNQWDQYSKLYVMTRESQYAGGRMSSGGLAQAWVWGICDVLEAEFTDMYIKRLDIDGDVIENFTERILSEIKSGQSEEKRVVLQKEGRYVNRLKRMESSFLQNRQKLKFTEGKAYMIIEGFNNTGLMGCRWLIKEGARHIFLLSGRSMDAENEKAFGLLEEGGARIYTKTVNVRDMAALKTVLEEICRLGLALSGMVYINDALDDLPLSLDQPGEFENLLDQKWNGAWNLHKLSLDLSIEFFIIFSSAMSLPGLTEKSAHTAAVTFFDALAFYRQFAGLPACSAIWGSWDEEASYANKERIHRMSAKGIKAFTAGEITGVLDFIMGSEEAQLIAMPIKWEVYNQCVPQDMLAQGFREIGTKMAEQENDILKLIRNQNKDERIHMIDEYVCKELSDIMGLKSSRDIDRHRGFFDLGLDSLMAVELRNRLQNSFHLSMPVSVTFDYPSIGALVGFIEQEVFKEPEIKRMENTEAGRFMVYDPQGDLEELSYEELSRVLLGKVGEDAS